ncbi:hypothetical protein [Streptomyces marincola]|uniref:hypothetical protein n=1 Tax=Streptomyces marincola TaxID=2878388 RepID=UPI001CF20CB5|nr:hypothetical protein [Streptomyces marincola]UCM88055.1 hypothetical protein LC193_08855 [Streptomyces marincola]
MTEPALGTAMLTGGALANGPRLLAPGALANSGVAAPNSGPPVLVIEQPGAGAPPFVIDATPRMPSVVCRARVTGIVPDPTPTTAFDWLIEIIEPQRRGTCASAGVLCGYQEYGRAVVGGSWQPGLAEIRGGEARIRASATVGGTRVEAETRVTIIGTNPSRAAVRALCGGAATDIARIACHESGMEQFGGNGFPKLGPGGDTGIMQLCNPAASCDERWNWKANVDRGIALFNQHKGAARQHLNAHTIDGKWPNDKGMTKEQMLQREAIKRFNGGQYWTWDATNSMWLAQPPGDYTDKVLAASCP